MKKSQIETIIIWGAIMGGYIITTYLTLNYKYQGENIDYTANLRATDKHFDWSLLPIMVCVLNFYQDEVRNGNWSALFAGIGFLTMDIYNEIWNALLYKFTNNTVAPWIGNLNTVYLVLVGWNIEIILTFLLVGLYATKFLPKDKDMKILGINNRHFIAIIFSMICVLVELILNQYGALVWKLSFWNAKQPQLIFLIGYLPFFEICYYIHDLPTFHSQLSFLLKFVGIAISLLTGCIIKGLM